MRLKTKWANKNKERTLAELAGALGFSLWRITAKNLLNLENEDYQTESQSQRLNVMAEFAAFLVAVADRIVAESFSDEQRQEFIVALALKLADTMQENREDCEGRGQDYKQAFIDMLNLRMSEYAEQAFNDMEPGYGFKRHLGNALIGVMGERHEKWLPAQIIEIEIPEAMTTLKRAMNSLLGIEFESLGR
ncbi:MAG: hypothetical protein OEY11_11835 [Gammaproteobacteria bacterium]|nr:hypothetical protein [Gammaproteobacteria bacterium]